MLRAVVTWIIVSDKQAIAQENECELAVEILILTAVAKLTIVNSAFVDLSKVARNIVLCIVVSNWIKGMKCSKIKWLTKAKFLHEMKHARVFKRLY